MSDENKSNSVPPWRTETWRLTHGPEGDRQTRWFLARLNDGDRLWSLKEPGTPYFIAGTLSPADGVALMAERAVDPVIEKLDPGSPDDLRSEINYLRSREAYFASVLKVADGGQYRADWKAPLQRVLDENKALRAEVDALRDGQEAVRLALVSALCEGTGNIPAVYEGHAIASMIRDLGRWVKWQNEVIDDQAKQQDKLADQNNALRGDQESVRLGLLACLLTATGDPRYSAKGNTMAVAGLTATLEKDIAALCRMREEALEGCAHAERTATALLGASAGPLRYYALAPDFEEHNSARIAQEAAEFALDQFRDQAGDGWDEDVEHIGWGVMLPCQGIAMVNEAPVDPASRFARGGMEYTCDYELQWVEGASGAPMPAADGPGLWVVRRPDETPALVVVGEGAAPPVTRLDGSDPGWGKYADRTDWTWERLPEAHAAMARVGYGEGYTDGAKAMRQYAAARLAHRASERLAVSRNPKSGWHSRNLADAEAAVLGDAEREVRGLALPASGVPRGE